MIDSHFAATTGIVHFGITASGHVGTAGGGASFSHVVLGGPPELEVWEAWRTSNSDGHPIWISGANSYCLDPTKLTGASNRNLKRNKLINKLIQGIF